MRRWLAVVAALGALGLAAQAQTPAVAPSASPSSSASAAEPAPPGVEVSAPDFSATKPEPNPPGFGEIRHNFDPLQMIRIPEDAQWAVPDPWTHGDVQLVWHSVTHWWIGGTGIASVGYAIRVPGHEAYWALDDDKIALFQVNNILPKTMPKGAIATPTLLLGWSFYILAGVVAAILVAGLLFGRGKPKKEPAA